MFRRAANILVLDVCIGAVVLFSYGHANDVNFANDIQTVLARKCYACHGPDQQEGSIRFDDRATIVGEADSGMPTIVPGNARQSELLRRLSTADESERMPPEGEPISKEQIALFAKWIDSGAEFSQHWAFQPIRKPALPDVGDTHWPSQPMDRFVFAKLESAGLAPVDPAPAPALVRRAYFDVIGLPPPPEAVADLVSNWNDASYVQMVDRLLADPAFGERWARNWLDVVRYAETNSFERDGAKPNAWKYRDYVIAAMNSDKPYSQFIREQIAGDELDAVTEQSLTATGYYRLGLWDDEPADPQQALFDGFDDLVSTTSQGVLGLTLGCARCHDHKIDPLTQKDYYSMIVFMRDVTPYGTRQDQLSYNQIDLDSDVAQQHDDLKTHKREIKQRTKGIETAGIKKMSAADQRATEGPERASVLGEKLEQFVDRETYEEYTELKAKLEAIAKQHRKLPPRRTTLGLARLESEPKQTFVLLRGSPHAPGTPVEPAFPALLGGGTPSISARNSSDRSAGRRRVLADWLASDDNWMTARVIVNRIWLHYFGRGIVRSPNNFGLMGDPPTHPELIDYLASELIRNDWHLKSIHRVILLSSTYRLGTQTDQNAFAQDPANDLFWRQNVRRLSAEQIRDSVLAVTGQLNEQRYGESMYPTLSAEVLASQPRPGLGWGKSSLADQSRRSIYIHVKRSLPVPMLSAFDFPETDISCEARFLTTQPGQPLTMLNSDWIGQQVALLYQRIEREVGNDLTLQVNRCRELVLSKPSAAVDRRRQAGDLQAAGREPSGRSTHAVKASKVEIPLNTVDARELISLVERLVKERGLSEDDARRAMCLVVLNLNEFLYLD